jgi:hypothetical protein
MKVVDSDEETPTKKPVKMEVSDDELLADILSKCVRHLLSTYILLICSLLIEGESTRWRSPSWIHQGKQRKLGSRLLVHLSLSSSNPSLSLSEMHLFAVDDNAYSFG